MPVATHSEIGSDLGGELSLDVGRTQSRTRRYVLIFPCYMKRMACNNSRWKAANQSKD